MAFAPDYASQRALLRLLHRPRRRQRVVEYQRASDRPRRRRQRAARVLRMDDPESNHNGGLLLFGPDELPLHRHRATAAAAATSTARAATRRTSARCSARSCGSTRAAAAAGRTRSRARNPFVGRSARAARSTAYGLRNPWRFSFDRTTGDLVDRRRRPGRRRGDRLRAPAARARGANFGWRLFEGNAPLHARRVGARRRRAGASSTTTTTATARSPAAIVVRDPALPGARRPLRLRRLLPGPLRRLELPAGRARAASRATAAERRAALLVRRGRPRAGLRRLARRARSTGSPRRR